MTDKEITIAILESVLKQGIVKPLLVTSYYWTNTWYKIFFGRDICDEELTSKRHRNRYRRIERDYNCWDRFDGNRR